MKALYWLAVLIVSLLIVIGVLLLLQSRDDSSLDSGQVHPRGLSEGVPRGLARAVFGLDPSAEANDQLFEAVGV
jgi:hypothetical protein